MTSKPRPTKDAEGGDITEAQLVASLENAQALISAMLSASRAAGSTEAIPRISQFQLGDVVVDMHSRRVTRRGTEVALAPREYELLVELVRHGGAAVSIEELIRTVWKGKVPAGSRTVAQHIAVLRSKLEEVPSRPRLILTVRKFGYRLSFVGGDV